MKKTLLILLSILMLISTSGVCAEENEVSVEVNHQFTVKSVVPEGYRYSEQFPSDILYIGYLEPTSPGHAQALVTIAYDEEAEGRTLNDYSEAELDALIQTFMKDTPTASVRLTESGKGTKLIVFNTENEYEHRVDVVTIWKGYQIAIMMFPYEGETVLDEASTEMILTFMTDMEIIM